MIDIVLILGSEGVSRLRFWIWLYCGVFLFQVSKAVLCNSMNLLDCCSCSSICVYPIVIISSILII